MGTGKHAVVPQQDPFFVAQIVEIFVFIQSAAPHPQRVHVRLDCIRKQFIIPFTGISLRPGIQRDPVCALGENRDPVHLEIKTYPMFVRMADGFQVSQADFFLDRAGIRLDRKIIQRLFAISGGIPQLRIFHRERCSDDILSRMQFR